MKEMDDIFKNALKNHEIPVREGLWDRIEEAQKEKNEDSGGLMWFSIAGAFILFLVLGFVAWNAQSTDNQKFDDHRPTSSKHLSKQKDSETTSPITTNRNKTINAPDLNNEFATTETRNNILNHTRDIDKKPTNIINNNFNGTNQNNISRSKHAITPVVKHFGLADASVSTNQVQKDNAKFEFFPNPDINTFDIDFIQNYIIPLGIDVQLHDPSIKPTDCPTFDRRKGYFAVKAYHASDLNLKTMTSSSQEVKDGYLKDRIISEKGLYSFSDGFELNYFTKNNLMIGSGVHYSQISERFTFTNEDARKSKTVITIDTIFDNNGSYTTSVDTYRVQISGIERNAFTNRYKSIDIPVNIGYQIPGKKMDINIDGGVRFNVYRNQSGRILNEENEAIYINSGTTEGDEIFSKRTGMSYQASIGFYYHLNEQLDIMMEPYYVGGTQSITNKNYPISQKYNTIGLRTGIRYNIGK